MKSVLTCLLILIMKSAFAQKLPHPSAVFEWNMLPAATQGALEERKLLDWPTETLENFAVDHYALDTSADTTLEPGAERLILVTDGRLALDINGRDGSLGARSVGLIPAGMYARLTALNERKASFFVISWETDRKGPDTSPSAPEPLLFDYTEMEFKENARGGRRSIMQAGTSKLNELEMHITTLREGEKSHDPHVHADEEIIVVLQGEVEELINGTAYRLGPGSVIYLAAFDPHGIRNAGSGTCEYYAIRWITDKTARP
ncbi:Cupin domain-containing protein [Cyclobacterium lianum]|uniref:Cupin domain-containing protein n=1 Tax=Cyclobacterium lianum TaxID=388280 RepID=A0A1M7PFM9_9BACT|nr:cupin domain-containing protein [Cyclobacterium lianum]SHN15786.1 Cupin domain-containing protein [Cyclobacterium lianum]